MSNNHVYGELKIIITSISTVRQIEQASNVAKSILSLYFKAETKSRYVFVHK